MSVSQHPVALRLEHQVGGATKLLATVMGLPLIDGILPALIIAGALESPTDIIETGLLIFGGSATVAVILAEMEASRREQVASILLLAAILLPVAAIEAAFVTTLDGVLNFETFHRFAGIVILAIAAKTASAQVGEYLPSPGAIIGLGLVASLRNPAEMTFVLDPNFANAWPAVAAVGVGIAFALSVALLAPRLRGAVDIDLFRFGSSVALGMLALSVLGVPGVPKDAPIALVTLGVTALFSFDPDSKAPLVADADEVAGEGNESTANAANAAVTDGGDSSDDSGEDSLDSSADAADDDDDTERGVDFGSLGDDDSRAPWL